MSAAGWLEPLLDAAQMRATDAWAIDDRGIPSLELMERAGEGLANEASAMAPAGTIVVLAGKGNNGGDGFVAARILREQGREVDVLLAGAPDEVAGDARVNLDRLAGAAPQPLPAALPPEAALLIDALLGTGATGEPRGAIAQAIALIAASGAPVLAADIPSGVDASSGEVAGTAVRAQATATFHAAKLGLWIEPGRGHAGAVQLIDIGIPDGAPVEAAAGLIGDRVLEEIPRRGTGSTKFTSGRLLVAGGSAGLTGAPCLAALAAARAGAGYVTVCAPASLSIVFESRLLEQMTLALPDADGAHTAEGASLVAERANGSAGGAVVLGPGLGRSDDAAAFVRGVLEHVERPILLDADGLHPFAGKAGEIAGRAAVLTPHEGELGRLLGVPSSGVAAARLDHARRAAAASGSVVVLKGDDTIVASPGGAVAVNRGATPALATAGTGDVLSGVIGALLAMALDPFVAACAGVRLHALAGIAAAGARGSEGLIASDVIEALSAVRA
jgi:NAD(P)H-hydrate epimerase